MKEDESLLELPPLTRRQFFKEVPRLAATGLAVVAGGSAIIDSLNKFAVPVHDVFAASSGEYRPSVIQEFDRKAKEITDIMRAQSMVGNYKPPLYEPEKRKNKTSGLINQVPKNTNMIFIPGIQAEQLWTWTNKFSRWMSNFETLRNGRSNIENSEIVGKYIQSLDVVNLMNASKEKRLQEQLPIVMSSHTPIFPWELVTDPTTDQSTPAEHPLKMAIYSAAYMKHVLEHNPQAKFGFFGQSLGAGAVHSFLRLIQGGVFPDLADKVPFAILYAQAFSDYSNEALYALAQTTGEEDIKPSTVNRMVMGGLDPATSNDLSMVLNIAVQPEYYSGVNPGILSRKYNIKTISVRSPQDQIACSIPGADEVLVIYPKGATPESKPRIVTGLAAPPRQIVTIPEDVGSILPTLKTFIHEPNDSAADAIFFGKNTGFSLN